MIIKTERLLEAQDEKVLARAGLSYEDSGEKPYQTLSVALILVNTIDERRFTPLEMGESADETSSGQEEKINTHHWLPDVFSQSRPATLLEDTEQTSILLGPHMLGSEARLSESYIMLLQLPFEDGDLLVRIYQRTNDARSRIFCRIERPPRLQKDCALPLVSLLVQRSGPFLKLLHVDASGSNPKLWAALKFPSYEGTFIDHCSICPWVVALRATGIVMCSP